MKPRVSHHKTAALTLVEVVVILCALAFVMAALLAKFPPPDKWKVDRVNCANNLKEISLAYKIWQGDHNDMYPMEFWLQTAAQWSWLLPEM